MGTDPSHGCALEEEKTEETVTKNVLFMAHNVCSGIDRNLDVFNKTLLALRARTQLQTTATETRPSTSVIRP